MHTLASLSIAPSHLLSDANCSLGWFRVVDINGDGRLSRQEAVEALKAQLPTDVRALDAAVADANHPIWEQWDKDGSGYIEKSELFAPQV